MRVDASFFDLIGDAQFLEKIVSPKNYQRSTWVRGFLLPSIAYEYAGKNYKKNPEIINRNLISPVRQVSTIIGLIISNTWFTFRDVKDIFTIFIIVIIAYFTFVFCRFMNQELFSLWHKLNTR